MEDLFNHLVNRSECVKVNGSFKFVEEFMHAKTS